MSKIKTSRRARKNIKNNLNSYQNQNVVQDVASSMLEKVMILVLGIVSAVTAIVGAINLVYRIPDFFRYEFGRTEISKSLDLEISDDDLGGFFSQFMMHSKDDFSLLSTYQGIERELFTRVEAGMMDNFRMLLDILLGVFVFTLILTIVLIAILQFNKMSKELRLALNIGLIAYIVIMVGLIVYFNVYQGDVVLVDAFAGSGFAGDDLLQQMFDERFTLDSTVIVCVISFIILMIIRYIVWKLTAQKGVFSEGLRGIGK